MILEMPLKPAVPSNGFGRIKDFMALVVPADKHKKTKNHLQKRVFWLFYVKYYSFVLLLHDLHLKFKLLIFIPDPPIAHGGRCLIAGAVRENVVPATRRISRDMNVLCSGDLFRFRVQV